MDKIVILIIGLITGILIFPFISQGASLESPFGITSEKSSPSDWISEEKIEVKSNMIIIRIDDAKISRYADTNSMDPTLDKNSNGIEIKPKSAEQIKPGDIITYQRGKDLIVHRVTEIGQDKNGWFCVTKGDNNISSDGKIRFKDIKYITIGIIY